MKISSLLSVLLVGSVLLGGVACELEPIQNPNGPTQESVLNGASRADLRLLAVGLESNLRNDMSFYYTTASIIGREYYDLRNTDPRYTGELLGAGPSAGFLDANGFLTTRAYGVLYGVVRNAEILITATNNANASLTEQEESALLGYATALKGYALLLLANRQYDNGIRLDTRDPDNLGPFTSSAAESYTGVQAILSDAATRLGAAGTASFPFALSSGFEGFNTPANFLEFVRALQARVALYQGNKPQTLTFLSQSFFDIGADLDLGAYHVFGASGNDVRNPLFFVPGQDRYFITADFLASAESGDSRIDAYTEPFPAPVVADGITGTVQVTKYASNVSPVAIIRNAELILIYAEANIGTNNTEALRALNVIRAAAGLPASAANSDTDLLNEVIRQRRYELFAEGHRWIDLRRLGRLGDIVVDRPGDEVFVQFPTPVSELP